jgi:hypothetical protein
MNKAIQGLLAASLAGGLGLGAATTASASPTSDKTISFTEHETSDQTFNLGVGNGVAVGFVELSANDDLQGGHNIGHDGGSCTITRLSNGTADDLCNMTFVLTGGQNRLRRPGHLHTRRPRNLHPRHRGRHRPLTPGPRTSNHRLSPIPPNHPRSRRLS